MTEKLNKDSAAAMLNKLTDYTAAVERASKMLVNKLEQIKAITENIIEYGADDDDIAALTIDFSHATSYAARALKEVDDAYIFVNGSTKTFKALCAIK